MTTETEAKYTLIFYRPNGEKYQGCGDYEHFDSEIGFDRALSFDQLKHRIIELTKRGEDCCDSRSDNSNPFEFAVLLDGKCISARGDNMWSFADDETEEHAEIAELFDSARVISEREKREKAEAKRKKEEAKAAESKRRAQEAAEAKDLAEFERLKTKFETTPKPALVGA